MAHDWVIKNFRAEHIEGQEPQVSQVDELIARQSDGGLDWSEAEPYPSFSCFKGDKCMVAAGLVPFWHGRAMGWCWFHREASSSELMFATRNILGFLDRNQASQEFRRIEATVKESFDQGHRWMGMLGFQCEGLMRCWSPSGQNYVLYARIRP